MSVTEQVKQAIYDALAPVLIGDLDDSDDEFIAIKRSRLDNVVTVAITAFLEAAAEQGWRLVPAEPTREMVVASMYDHTVARAIHTARPEAVKNYRAMLEVAPKFKLDGETP